ncbi:MAG: hypothetical protein ABH885_02075 [Candidatus Omnitrophota bacterium]
MRKILILCLIACLQAGMIYCENNPAAITTDEEGEPVTPLDIGGTDPYKDTDGWTIIADDPIEAQQEGLEGADMDAETDDENFDEMQDFSDDSIREQIQSGRFRDDED